MEFNYFAFLILLYGFLQRVAAGGPASAPQHHAVVVPQISDALLPRGADGQPLALPWGKVSAPAGTENLCTTTRSGGRVWGKNAGGRLVLQVPAAGATVGQIIGSGGATIARLGVDVPNLGKVQILKVPSMPRSGDVWFVLDANNLQRACVAARDIENLIIAIVGS